MAASGAQVPPGEARLGAAPELLFAGEAIEHVELVRAARQPPLLELAGHRDQALADGGEIFARGTTAPRVRPRPAVGEHTAGEHQAVLTRRLQLRQRGELLLVEQ